MRRGRWAVVCCLLCLRAEAQTTLTLEAALDRARAAPAVRAAEQGLAEARARRLSASLRPNPVLEAAAGTDLELSLSQDLSVGGRRRARLAGADARVERMAAEVEETRRVRAAAVAEAFVRGQHAEERLRLAAGAEAIARQIASAAERRHRAGDVAILEAHLAASALSLAVAERMAAEADRVESLGGLKSLLGIDPGEPVILEGALLPEPDAAPPGLLEASRSRPDLRVLAAEEAEAAADRDAARAERFPDLGVGASYEREDGEGRSLAGIRLTLPVRDRGQGLAAEAEARARRLEIEGAAAVRAVEGEVRASAEAYAARRAAVAELSDTALPLLEENERLAARSYEVGQIGLGELLLVRREIADTRSRYFDHLLEAALSRVALLASAGVLR